MKNYIAPGDILPFTAAADVVSGQGVLVVDTFGVATGDVANGEPGLLKLCGVFELPKVGSQGWTPGDKVYWDNGNSRCTTVAAGNTLIGVVYAPVASGAGDTLGQVRLNGAAI